MGDGGFRQQAVTPRMSFRMARGLRRELFREIDEDVIATWPLLQRRISMARLPYRSGREAIAVYKSLREGLRAHCHAFGDTGMWGEVMAQGVVMVPDLVRRNSAEQEEVLTLRHCSAGVAPGRLVARVTDCGRISHHAIERMFERLDTLSKQTVLEDLEEALRWLLVLHSRSAAASSHRRMLQLPIPTARGILLCLRDPKTGQFDVRTFVNRGNNDRLDASVAELEKWRQDSYGWTDSSMKSFDKLLNAPANHWWRTPYMAA